MLILAVALQSQAGAPARLRNYRGAPLFDRIRTLTPATDILARPAPGLIFPAEYANPCHPVTPDSMRAVLSPRAITSCRLIAHLFPSGLSGWCVTRQCCQQPRQSRALEVAA